MVEDTARPAAGPLVSSLLAQAAATRHRRLLVLHGSRSAALSWLAREAGGEPLLLVSSAAAGVPAGWSQVEPSRVGGLLGSTQRLVALDLHDGLFPNVIGALCGIIAGGGLLCLLAPPAEEWPLLPDAFAERLITSPYDAAAVGRRFLARFLASLERAAGLAVVDLGAGRLLRSAPALRPPAEQEAPAPGAAAAAPEPSSAAEDAADPLAACCRGRDQAAALAGLRGLAMAEERMAAVLVADRGRGKSSALGLLAAHVLAQGGEVVVTGPGPAAVQEVFGRAADGLAALGLPFTAHRDPRAGAAILELHVAGAAALEPPPRPGPAGAPGSLRFLPPLEAAAVCSPLLLVDEAAVLPVPLLDRLLASSPRVAFATTVHGYEGTGRGFDVRFRAHLEADGRPVLRLSLQEPIRWAPGDPLEAWCRDALLLDARPATAAELDGATPATVSLAAPDQDALAAAPGLLAEAFGLLTLAHYRTTPDDLARMLDAPNLRTRLLLHEGHVAAVCLCAEEGGLEPATCAGLYLGRHRIRGHMLPESLVSHLGVEEAGGLAMMRIVRLAVHPALQRRGLGRLLLERVAGEQAAAGRALAGTGFAATAGLLRFWQRCGYVPVRLSVTRNPVSGEHSVIMLRGLDGEGRALAELLGYRFGLTTPAILGDALRGLDPGLALAALAAVPRHLPPQLADWEWRDVVAASFGHRLYDVTVRPIGELVRAYLTDPAPRVELPPRERQRLLLKVVQRRSWAEVAAALDEPLHACMRNLREALAPLVRAYGPPELGELIARFRGARHRKA